MDEHRTPYLCHVFVCVNDRQGSRKSCADGASPALKDRLKEEVASRGLKGRVRVSHSGCLGLCAKGVNVLLHPQGIWFREVTVEDAGAIVERIEAVVDEAE